MPDCLEASPLLIHLFTTKKNSLKCKIDCLLPKYLHWLPLSSRLRFSFLYLHTLFSMTSPETSTALPWALGLMNSFSFLCPENILFLLAHFFVSALTVDFLLCSPYLSWPQTSPIQTSPPPEKSMITPLAREVLLTVFCLVYTWFYCFTPSIILQLLLYLYAPFNKVWALWREWWRISHFGNLMYGRSEQCQYGNHIVVLSGYIATGSTLVYHYQYYSHFVKNGCSWENSWCSYIACASSLSKSGQNQFNITTPSYSVKLLDLVFHVCLLNYLLVIIHHRQGMEHQCPK